MAATGTLFVRVCPTNPETTTPVCYWQEVDSGALSAANGMTPEQLHEIVNGVIWILALIFIFAMLKKAIEQ
jgi:hypothetical protein